MENVDLLNMLRLKPTFLNTDQYDIIVLDDENCNKNFLSTK